MRPFGRLLRSLFLPGSIQSRERSRWCGVDSFPSGTYNDRFLKHRADGDFVRNPEYLWSPGPYWAARGGFDAHFRRLADQLAGAVYSDALLVLHPEDHARTRASLLRSWESAAAAELADCWRRLLESEGWTRAVPGRDLHLRVLPDGDPALGSTLGLEPGEFATALMPNLHLGPGPEAVPLVEVFAADPSGRFSSIGTLWSDQLAFSVGAHALDNGRRAELGDSCVYTVHRIPGEDGLHHRLGAGREDRFVLRTGTAQGGETVQVVDVRRDKVVLEVMLVAARHLAAELPRVGERPDAPRVALPAFAPPPVTGFEGTILPGDLDLGTLGAFSIVPESLPDRVFTLVERGYLLQRVHFKDAMRGYRIEIDRDGRIGPKVGAPVATVRVRDGRVEVEAVERDVSVDGRPLRPGESAPLDDLRHSLSWRGGSVEYGSMRRSGDRKWPYLGCLTAPRRTTPLPLGETCTIGRDGRSCDVPLPDRAVGDNIDWRDGATTGPIEVQGGEVDRRTFRTDAICVPTRAAALTLTAGAPSVENLSGTCSLHVLRPDGEMARLGKGASAVLTPGDELCIGNLLFSLLLPGDVEEPLRFGGKRVEAPEPQHRRRAAVLAESARRPSAGGRKPLPAGRTVGEAIGSALPVEARVTQIGPAFPTAPVPTDQLPSLQLDPTTVGEWPTLLGDTPVSPAAPSWRGRSLADGTPTVLGGEPVLASVDPDAEVEDVPELEDLPLLGVPRGLQIHTSHGEPSPRYPTPSRRPRAALPGFGPVVPRPGHVSVEGDG